MRHGHRRHRAARHRRQSAPPIRADGGALLCAAAEDDSRGDRHQRQDLGRRLHSPDLGSARHTAASLGTSASSRPASSARAALTTPDPVTLHRELAELARAGIDHVALEASSHGLDQFRLDGLNVAAAAFTNLTRDHLDYHADMAALSRGQGAAVRRAAADGRHRRRSIPIRRSQTARLTRLSRARGQQIITYGRDRPPISGCRTRSRRPRPDASPSRASAHTRTAWSAAGRRVPSHECARARSGLAIARRRARRQPPSMPLPHLDRRAGPHASASRAPMAPRSIVDYAHTPDALETVLHGAAAALHAASWSSCSAAAATAIRASARRWAPSPQQLADIGHRHRRQSAQRRAGCDPPPPFSPPAPARTEIGDRAEAIRTRHQASLQPAICWCIAGKGHEHGPDRRRQGRALRRRRGRAPIAAPRRGDMTALWTAARGARRDRAAPAAAALASDRRLDRQPHGRSRRSVRRAVRPEIRRPRFRRRRAGRAAPRRRWSQAHRPKLAGRRAAARWSATR